jgi:hypothetical protein
MPLSEHKPGVSKNRYPASWLLFELHGPQMQTNYLIQSSAEETAICSNAARKTGCVGQIERWYAGFKRGTQIQPQYYIYIHTYIHITTYLYKHLFFGEI